MDDKKNERKFYVKEYSKFWINQTKKYGLTSYERALIRLISKSRPKTVFEVGIGTGWPIGASLKAKGIQVDGCDIAPNLVALARKQLDNEQGIWTGDVMQYTDDLLYDVTYCVRASWCIPDFYQTVEKMISMTKPGGYIIFDVMNQHHILCLKAKLRSMAGKLLSRMLYKDFDSKKDYGHHFLSVKNMNEFCKKNRLECRHWGERELTGDTDIFHTPKVVFRCRKKSC